MTPALRTLVVPGLSLAVLTQVACGPDHERAPMPPPVVEDTRHPLERAGMTLYHGDDPPDVEGDYLLDSLSIVYDDDGLRMDFVDYDYHFSAQTAAGEVEVAWEAHDIVDTASGLKGTIEGDAGCFTAYVNMAGTTSGCEYVMENVFAGCMSAAGIDDWHLGFVMLSKTGSGCDALVPVDHRRVIREVDGLAAAL
jgi:hypothetical protein